MKHLKSFNESKNSSILKKLMITLEDKIDYDFDRDYDGVLCHMSHGENGTWTKLIDSIYNIVRPELNKYGSDIDKKDFEDQIETIIPSAFTIGHQNEDLIDTVYDDNDANFDWDLDGEDDKSQRGIDIKYENIAESILKKFGLI